ncbi:hypothetical protein D3C81_1234320 [compost metagenome]
MGGHLEVAQLDLAVERDLSHDAIDRSEGRPPFHVIHMAFQGIGGAQNGVIRHLVGHADTPADTPGVNATGQGLVLGQAEVRAAQIGQATEYR